MRVEGIAAARQATVPVNRAVSDDIIPVTPVRPQNAEREIQSSLPTKHPTQLTQAEKNVLPISEKALLEAIEAANKSVSGANTRFEFSIHEKTKQIMVKVIDEESNEIIRQIPPEKILDMIAGIWEAVGLFVDEKR